jgi:hypothetical protein
MALKKALIERALGGELFAPLGLPPGAAKPEDLANQRNGGSAKTCAPTTARCASGCRATRSQLPAAVHRQA